MKNDIWNNLNVLVRLRLGAIALAAVLAVGAFYTGVLSIQKSALAERATGLAPYPDSTVSSEEISLNGRNDDTPTPVEGLVYNGAEQTLITNTENAQYVYAVKPSDVGVDWNPNDAGWSSDVPQGIDAGSYCIYYKASGSEETELTPVTVTIAQKELTAQDNPDNSITFNGLVDGEVLTSPEDYICVRDEGGKLVSVTLTDSAKAQNYRLKDSTVEISAEGGEG